MNNLILAMAVAFALAAVGTAAWVQYTVARMDAGFRAIRGAA